MKILRSAILAAGTAATILSTTTPANAVTAAVVQGTATIGCSGCGIYGPAGNSASFTVTGVWDNVALVGAPAIALFTVEESTGTGCVVSGEVSGTVTVAGDPFRPRNLTWTRIGAYAVALVRRSSRPTITMHLVFAVTNTATVPPCGDSVTASFAGEAHGA